MQSCLEIAIEICEIEHMLTFVSVDIEVSHEHDAVFSQCSRLVSTENIHRSKILNCIEFLDNDFLLRHFDRAFCEVCGDNERKHFRSKSDSDSERKEQCSGPALCETIYYKHNRHHDEHECNEKPAHFVDPFIKTRERSCPCEALCH